MDSTGFFIPANKKDIMTNRIISALCLLVISTGVQAQRAISEIALKRVIEKGWSAAIRVFEYDTVARKQIGGPFSAVVVSKDGYILTVAHAAQPGKIYKVNFADGKEAIATGAGRTDLDAGTGMPDMAMMKIITPGSWPFAEMGWSGQLQAGDPCVLIGYPETLSLNQPTVRLGAITIPLNVSDLIVSSATMEVGDSGGPVFDKEGNVIGLNSKCDRDESYNYHVPVDLYRKYWTAMMKPVNYTALPAADSVQYPAIPAREIIGLDISDVPQQKSVLALNSIINGKQQSIAATIWKEEKEGIWLLSKSSCVGENIVIRNTGTQVVVVKRNKELDLVLLYAKEKIKGHLAVIVPEQSEAPVTGTFITGLLPEGKPKYGIASSSLVELVAMYSAGYFGASFEDRDGAVMVEGLDPSGPGRKAGVIEGDRIININGVAATTSKLLIAELKKFAPQNKILVAVQREGNILQKEVTLGNRQHPNPNHLAEMFKGGKSERRDGFREVWLSDIHLEAAQCGSPVFNGTGKLLGIGIARFSRSATVVMPVEIIKKWIEEEEG